MVMGDVTRNLPESLVSVNKEKSDGVKCKPVECCAAPDGIPLKKEIEDIAENLKKIKFYLTKVISVFNISNNTNDVELNKIKDALVKINTAVTGVVTQAKAAVIADPNMMSSINNVKTLNATARDVTNKTIAEANSTTASALSVSTTTLATDAAAAAAAADTEVDAATAAAAADRSAADIAADLATAIAASIKGGKKSKRNRRKSKNQKSRKSRK